MILSFPGVAIEGYTKTSDETWDYNCIGWAASDKNNWWWPRGIVPGTGKIAFWPRKAPKKETIGAFVRAFEQYGYKPVPGNNAELHEGYEKVAIYALGNEPKHAARQLRDGNWTHKLGYDWDITASLTAMEGEMYGKVVRVLRRKRRN